MPSHGTNTNAHRATCREKSGPIHFYGESPEMLSLLSVSPSMEDLANDRLHFDSEPINWAGPLDSSVLCKLTNTLLMLNKCRILSTINYSVCNEENALANAALRLSQDAVRFQHHITKQIGIFTLTARLYTFVLMTHL